MLKVWTIQLESFAKHSQYFATLAPLHRCLLPQRAMSTTEPEKGEEEHEPEGQSLYADEEGEESNPDPNEFDERPPECTPFGPTPYFELVSDFFEKLQDMRGKRTAKGAKGSAEKKRALVQHMFNVRLVAIIVSCRPSSS